MDPNRQPDQSNSAPKRSMDGVRRTGGTVAQPQPLRPLAPAPKQPQPKQSQMKQPQPKQQPVAPVKKKKNGRRVVRVIAQTFLAIVVILAVAGAIVWLYLRYYQ